jgi:predicted glycoside hydrolase/deacetylase ChbG (UPF0249 family)
METVRTLIVNADDLGLSANVNAGIAAAHERGIVTSASAMVRRPAAVAAATLAASAPELAVGLHLDLGQWDYVEGEWRLSGEPCSSDDAAAVERECRAQLELFHELFGADPTHLDSHQHVHMSEPVSAAAAAIAAELEVPLRDRGIRYEGGFYGQSGKGEPFPEGIGVGRLVELIEALPPGRTELGCHPGLGVGRAESSYAVEREREVAALCDERARAAVERGGIRLCSFAVLGGAS